MCWPMGALFKTSILFCEDIRNMEFEALFWVEDFPAVETEINIAGIALHHSRSWTRGFYIDPIGLIKWIELFMCPPMQLTGSFWKQRDSGHVCPGSVAETDLKPTPCRRESHTIHLLSSFFSLLETSMFAKSLSCSAFLFDQSSTGSKCDISGELGYELTGFDKGRKAQVELILINKKIMND